MTQLQVLSIDEQAIAQSKFEQYEYIPWQADSMVCEAGGISSVQSMTQNFLSSANDPNTPVPVKADFQTAPGREPIKHTLIGSPKAVKSTIHYLQVIGYADATAWSPLVPTPNSGEVMSILTRYILVQ